MTPKRYNQQLQSTAIGAFDYISRGGLGVNVFQISQHLKPKNFSYYKESPLIKEIQYLQEL
jgi:hypothetical protein